MKVNEWTGKETVSINGIIEVLNRINKLDPNFMEQLISTRINCNERLADGSHVQVQVKGDRLKAGFLGVLNGLIGLDHNFYGPFTADIDDENGNIKEFRLTNTKAITEIRQKSE